MKRALYLVTYDVSTTDEGGKKRLRRVAKICESRGQRVQKSVFEILVSPTELIELKHRLIQAMDLNKDSLRLYRLIEPRENHIETYGVNDTIDVEAPLIF